VDDPSLAANSGAVLVAGRGSGHPNTHGCCRPPESSYAGGSRFSRTRRSIRRGGMTCRSSTDPFGGSRRLPADRRGHDLAVGLDGLADRMLPHRWLGERSLWLAAREPLADNTFRCIRGRTRTP
jgi:hypothetical protein